MQAQVSLLVSQMPAEDMRLLGQRQRALLLTTIAVARWSAPLVQFTEPRFPQDHTTKSRCHLYILGVALQESNADLRDPKHFIEGSKLFSEEDILCVPRMSAV